ncbi:hypothetical protein Scep_009541 [Stephania cephalantha]|uniref:Uncharacterized protein n=1 Tax=Stephania cephalantha TaxID=152367 RepID=A0AAP0JVP2_9MAGN
MRWAKTYVPTQCTAAASQGSARGQPARNGAGDAPADALAGDGNPVAAFVGDAAPY